MLLDGVRPHRTFVRSLALLALAARAVNGLTQAFCSSENTGADNGGVALTFNSNGACFTRCQDDFAFAVVQWQSCWCSNFIPADQLSVDDCSQHCPGFPDEHCGNAADGLFGYVQLNIAPLGTAGFASSSAAPAPSSSAPPSTSSPPQSTFAPSTPPQSSPPESTPAASSFPASSAAPPATSLVSQTVYRTVTPEPSWSASVVESYVTVTPPPPPSSSSIAASTSFVSVSVTVTRSPAMSVSVSTIAAAGTTQTVTTTPVTVPDSPTHDRPFARKQDLSGGTIAGIIVGALLGVAALLAAAFFLWRRRRWNHDEEVDATAAAAAVGRKSRIKRNTSVLSRTGLLSRGRPTSMAEQPYDDTAGGSASVRHSLFGGAIGSSSAAAAAPAPVDPASPLGGPPADTGSPHSRRASLPRVYDQRLNPSALFPSHDNGSRVSIQDQHDYSRPLGAVYPDLRPSFESRYS